MRIISKFRDYYDGVQSMAMDTSLVYVRKFQEGSRTINEANRSVLHNEFLMPFGLPSFTESFCKQWFEFDFLRRYNDRLTYYMIGFCGKYYIGAYFRYPHYNPTRRFTMLHKNHKGDCFYSRDAILAHKVFKESKSARKDTDAHHLGESRVQPFSDPLEPFLVTQSPILYFDLGKLGSEWSVRINPELAELQFYKVMDAFTTFQELSMFLGGVMPSSENNTVDISDEDMRDAKGFDNWSFKNMPTKKR